MKKFDEILEAVFWGCVTTGALGLIAAGWYEVAMLFETLGLPELVSGLLVVGLGLVLSGIYYIKNR